MRHNQIQILGCIVLTAVARLRHELYLKLVVTALDYSTEDTRQLLVRALTQATEPGRVYATRWLGVLARYTQIIKVSKNIRGPHHNMLLVSRLGQTNIAVYGVELLVRQVMDESLAVASTALG